MYLLVPSSLAQASQFRRFQSTSSTYLHVARYPDTRVHCRSTTVRRTGTEFSSSGIKFSTHMVQGAKFSTHTVELCDTHTQRAEYSYR
eukprot:SAG11_NODE_1793_length_4252_cov_6.530701_2_plen_88_part_00